MQEMEITVATELSSTTITNILEAVPGIKTVLRSPAADAMVNLTRAAAGIGDFDLKDARELMRFAFRRGLINNEEHDHVLADVEGAAQARHDRLAARKAARDHKKRVTSKPRGAKPKAAKPNAARHRPRPAAKKRPVPRKARPTLRKAKVVKKARPTLRKAKVAKKARPVPRKVKTVKKARPVPKKTKAAKKAKPSARSRPKALRAKKRR
jgi:hypothetical protein